MRLSTPDRSADAFPLGWAVLFVFAVTLLRTGALLANRTDLYFDEAQYWTWSQALDWGYYSKPPLIALVIAATTALFGNEEWAVRLASPVLHGCTALVLLSLGTALYGRRVGAWSAVVYATMPAVAFSSTLISTDVPLLLCWAIGLLAAVRLLEGNGWRAALALGAAVAVGINAKYPMALLPGLVLVFVLLTPEFRPRLRSARLWTGLLSGLVGLLPNAIWNARNGWVTLMHTRDNANWQGSLFHPDEMLEFAGAQFGVFGPILLVVLLLAGLGVWRTGRRNADRFLLWTSLPILALFTLQGLLSRANANWGATAYPAATVLVTAVLLAPGRHRLFRASLALHGLVAIAMLLAPLAARTLHLPNGRLVFERIVGWRELADAVATTARERGTPTLILDRRSDTAALLYYLRDAGFHFAVVTVPGKPPRDHYEMILPLRSDLPRPGLLVRADEGLPLPEGMESAGPPVLVPVMPGVLRSGHLRAEPVTWGP
ncbi:ArnT family glycosyltransferase [Chthonobacter albigriseus]|uniref:ArnT family glycosyltransferase n=1 Tax=Chthonobacter albigriseus TaxID=1683161 RepID=UPI0015EFAF48|nr:glycosyltransferase family 39 protein [Chthonobacter albigriseus]